MLTRGWTKFLVLIGFALEFFGAVVSIAAPEDDEPTERERASAVHVQSAEQAPPPASMPFGNRYIHTEPQNHSRFTPVDDWMLGIPPVLLHPARE